MSDLNRSSGRWQRTALAASIILNLFLLAIVGGHWWHSRAHTAGPTLPFDRVMARIESSFSPKEAAAFRDVMRRDAPQYLDAALQLRAKRQALNHQVGAERFDPEATRRALVDWQHAWNEFLSDFSGPLVEALAQVSPESRRKLLSEPQGDSQPKRDSTPK
jgi:uncharacterized membrane protein